MVWRVYEECGVYRKDIGKKMKYFILEQGKEYTRNPQIKGWYGKLDIHSLKQVGSGLKDKMIFEVDITESTLFPDILVKPVLMVSAAMRDIIFKYEKKVFFKEVLFMNVEGTQKYTYYIPFLPRVNCFKDVTCFHKNMNKKETCIVDISKMWNRHIVEAEGNDEQCIVISLDLAESILRKGLIGIGLREVSIE